MAKGILSHRFSVITSHVVYPVSQGCSAQGCNDLAGTEVFSVLSFSHLSNHLQHKSCVIHGDSLRLLCVYTRFAHFLS